MSVRIIIIIVLVVLVIGYYAYSQMQPVYIQSPDKVCGVGYGSQPGSSASLDCMRSIWLNAKCTDKGTVWQNALDLKLPVDKANAQVKWWSDRQKISDIESDMELYYSLAVGGNQSHITSCGI